ncbi:MAG: nebramycin 5' synthase [candidate division WS2 bacterium]|nr:nebramycin 5' synthase [Candidatus Psychracetigena formicireducens]
MEISDKHKTHVKTIEEFDGIKVVEDIKKQPVLWLEGRSEVGPRALGHRSIIADPTNTDSKEIINKIKGRQWWRPVAPIILLSELHNWFENAFASPYMLNNFIIKDCCKALVPAILHLDNTARVQTIDDNSEDLIAVVLKNFKNTYKIPMLCNTSLNDKGEPIIESLDQAMNFALRKGINIVYCNGKRYELCKHDIYDDHFPLNRAYLDLEFSKDDLGKKNKLNPHGLSDRELHIYLSNRNLYNKYDITDEKKANDLKKVIKYMIRASMINKPIT